MNVKSHYILVYMYIHIYNIYVYVYYNIYTEEMMTMRMQM